MEITTSTVVTLLTALGIGGILGAYFQSLFQHKREVKEHEHELKRKRYGCILILLLTKLDPETGLPHVERIRPDLKDVKDVEKEIETEMLNGVLFASDDVIKSMSEFVHQPTHKSYVRVATAMRKDLWNKKTKIDEQILDVFKK